MAALRARSAQQSFAYVVTPNAKHVTLIHRAPPEVASACDGAWLSLCDSRVLALLARPFGLRLPVVTGSDLTVRLIAEVIARDEPVTVIGGDAVLERRLRETLGLTGLALFDPPFGFAGDPAELARAAAFVEAHPARFIFLACGAPQSELLAALLLRRGQARGTALAIGASLLFATGLVRRAPRLWQALALEWLYRLLQEPGRMGRRLWREQLPVLVLAARYRLVPALARDHSQRPRWR